MVDIPDAIPAELSYQVRYEGEGAADRDGGRPAAREGGLAVKLAKSQDLRVSPGADEDADSVDAG